MHDLPYIVTPDGCHETTLSRTSTGYAQVKRDQVWWKAHRYVWTEAFGPIPEGLVVMHRCDNPPCINIEHLLLGTYQDNALDMWTKGRGKTPGGERNARKTECPRGHPYSEGNTHVRSNGKRECRACWRERKGSGVGSPE